MERVIEVGDLTVRLSAADGRRAAALENLLGRWPESRASPEIWIRYELGGPELPDRPADVRSAATQVWFAGTDVVAVEPSGISGSVSSGEIWLGGPSTDLAGGLSRLFLSVLTHALFPYERFVLHAGAIDLGGRAALLLGASGMGKSTLAFAGSGMGWRVLGDDIVMLRRRGEEKFEVAGLSARAAVVPSEVLEGPGERGERLPGDPRRRSVLSELSPERGWSIVATNVLVVHGEAPKATLAPVASGTALSTLLQSSVATINPRLLPTFFAAAHRLAQEPSFRLAQGRDPVSRLIGAQACLGELAGRLRQRPAAVASPCS